MLGRMKKGQYVVGLRAIGVGEWRFRRGPAICKRNLHRENARLLHGANEKRENLALFGD